MRIIATTNDDKPIAEIHVDSLIMEPSGKIVLRGSVNPELQKYLIGDGNCTVTWMAAHA